MASQFNHIGMNDGTSFFFKAKSYSVVNTNCIFSSHSFIDGHLDRVHILATRNNTTVSNENTVSLGDPKFSYFRYILNSKIASS